MLDLAHTLQPIEYQRLNPTEQLEMARQLQRWMQSGSDFWGLYQQFDQAYGGSLVGDYDYNREVYIQLATQNFAPSYTTESLPPLAQPPLGYGMPEYEPPGYNQPDYYQPNPYQPNPYADPEARPNQPDQPYPQPSPQIPNLLETST